MARKLGLSAHSSITYYEAGRRIPPADIIDAYERVLGIDDRALHRARLEELAARVQRDEAVSDPAALPVSVQVQVQAHARAEPTAVRSVPARRRFSARRLLVASLAALVLLTTAASSAALGAKHDGSWAQSTQNVTSRIEPASSPEPMDGDDPRARDCYPDAVVVQAVPLPLPNGDAFGTLRLRHSAHCGASWGSAYYANPDLFTVRITVHRPEDGAIVRDDWSNNTPPGSYSDMLSTASGCVWVEAVVITPSGTSSPAKTSCLV